MVSGCATHRTDHRPGHALPQHGRDGSIPPDVAAVAGVDTVVDPRLVRLAATQGGSRGLSVSIRCGRGIARRQDVRQGFEVPGGAVRDAARRPGDRVWSVEAQRAAMVANLADVWAGQGEADVAKPPGVCARVGVRSAVAFGLVDPWPQTHGYPLGPEDP